MSRIRGGGETGRLKIQVIRQCRIYTPGVEGHHQVSQVRAGLPVLPAHRDPFIRLYARGGKGAVQALVVSVVVVGVLLVELCGCCGVLP